MTRVTIWMLFASATMFVAGGLVEAQDCNGAPACGCAAGPRWLLQKRLRLRR